MGNQKKKRLLKFVSAMLALVLAICAFPMTFFAAETTQHGEWTVVNDGTTSGTATIEELGFTYYSPTTEMTTGTSGGKNWVRSRSTNGKASNGLVITNNQSYCEFTAKNDGTLTVYVGNASTKTGYVSKTDAAGTSTAIGSYVPGGTDDYNVEGMEVIQGKNWATLNIEVQKGVTYYITVAGSKMSCYGAEFAPYTVVTGNIDDSFNLSGYEIKFVNADTQKATMATVTGKTYSVTLKPGEYTASLVGANGTGYAFSNDTRKITVQKSETIEPATQTANLTVQESVSYKVSGTISGMADGYSLDDLKLVLTPEDTTSCETVIVERDGVNYSAQLVASQKYTLSMTGAYDYALSEEIVVYNETKDPVEKNIVLAAVPTYEVNGEFLGLGEVRGEYNKLNVTPSEIKFTNVEDKYVYAGTAADAKYSVKLRDGSYLAEITAEGYSTSTHVVVKGGAVTRDLLLKDTTVKTVEYKDTLYVGADKEYKTVQAAVDAATAMTRTEGQRVTIKVDPGKYREQVVVRTPDITIESNGGSAEDTIITWYYGIGYKYYSSVQSLYDPYADYDQFEKGNVEKYWGATVIPMREATNFRMKDITLENSFNKYMTEEELEDGVEVNGLTGITVVRKETTDVEAKSSTERAAALVNYADKTEFMNCKFIGSQDTLYTCNVNYDAYYKNCYIEGQTDFIYGNGDVIFDGCEINFCGYSDTAASGYLTAQSSSKDYFAEDGYIFRNCYVSYNDERKVTAGTFGRMWGVCARVAFIDTVFEEDNMITADGWTAMGSTKPTDDTVTLVEYNSTHNGKKISTDGRVAGVVDTLDYSKYTVKSVFIDKGWTPAYYTEAATTAPTFKTAPTFTSNGDLNTPNPGETVTVNYELGSEWAAGDASRIEWYAVDTNCDKTSLDTILKSATLLKATSAVSSTKFQIPMECAGKYIMAVVTPVTLGGTLGEAKYIMDTEKEVSNTWSDPDNEGSLAPGQGINIYLAGDSTVKDYSAAGIYNGGKILSAGSWGEFLQDFFNSDAVTVNNYAQGGRSLRSFLNEGKFQTIMDNIKAGDYLLIQFGHNDSSNGAAYYQDRFVPLYTADAQPDSKSSGFPTVKPTESMLKDTPDSFKSQYGDKYYSWDCGATYKGYIQEYIDQTLAKGAIPVVVTPVARQYYDSEGNIRAHHDSNSTDYEPTAYIVTENNAYVTACKEIYEANKDKGVLFIDAFAMTVDMYEAAYDAGGATLGGAVMDDGTHSNKTGGVIQAGLIAKWFQEAGVSVSKYVVQPQNVYGEETSGEYIFTIKNGTFTAKNKALVEQPFWSQYGQVVFDSLATAEKPGESETQAPTEAPTQAPTEAPTQKPTEAPTQAPTEAPTQAPTQKPTEAPTQAPTEAPTQPSTEAPTQPSTEAPTTAPSKDDVAVDGADKDVVKDAELSDDVKFEGDVKAEDVKLVIEEAVTSVVTTVKEALTKVLEEVSVKIDDVDAKYYDISLKAGNNVVKLESGKIEITFAWAEGKSADKHDAKVYHYNKANKLEEVKATVTADGIKIEADDFSPYVVVYSAKTADAPGTGDAAPIALYITLCAMMLAAGVVVCNKKRA